MQPIQVRASCLALLALIGGAAWGYENGGRAFRPSGLENSNNRMVRPLTNEKNRYSVISKDVKREVDAGDGCCRADDVSTELFYFFFIFEINLFVKVGRVEKEICVVGEIDDIRFPGIYWK